MASLNSLAMTLAMVLAGANSEATICARLPMTMVTAIVSPMARPRPSMIAPRIPVRPYGNTATRTISHLVAPKAKAASRCACGTARSTSCVTEVMYGTIITARIIEAVSKPIPYLGPWNSGKKPNAADSAGSM